MIIGFVKRKKENRKKRGKMKVKGIGKGGRGDNVAPLAQQSRHCARRCRNSEGQFQRRFVCVKRCITCRTLGKKKGQFIIKNVARLLFFFFFFFSKRAERWPFPTLLSTISRRSTPLPSRGWFKVATSR